MMGSKPGRPLKTTGSSLKIIETIVERGGATSSTLVEELNLSQSTVNNHLNTLIQHGYLSKHSNTYYAGAKFCQIGDHVRQCKPEYVIAGEVVSEIATESELDADFTVEENGRVISIYNGLRRADSAHFLNAGQFYHVHSTASGKAILSEYSRERVERIIDQRGLPPRTDNTITSKEELYDELDTVRERGYATNKEESLDGLWAVAKAVRNPIGEVVGSLNLSGPLYLHTESVRKSAITLLTDYVDKFEQRVEDEYRSAD